MSRTSEMAQMLMDWLRGLDYSNFNYPIYANDALDVTADLEPLEAIYRICENSPTSLQLITNDPDYLDIAPTYNGQFMISEMIWQPEDLVNGLGEHYIKRDVVEAKCALDAVINLKQRFERSHANAY